MRFINSIIAGVLTGTLGYIAVSLVSLLFMDNEPGSLDGLSYLIITIPIFLLLTFLLVLVFFIFYHRMNMHGMVFGGVAGLLFTQLILVVLELIPFSPESVLPYIINYYRNYRFILIILAMVTGLIFIKKSTKWLHLNGFVLGSMVGLIVSYSFILILRKLNNTLTSYFYLDATEMSVVVAMAILGSIVGNQVGKKRYFVES